MGVHSNKLLLITSYGFTHALVDAACAALSFRLYTQGLIDLSLLFYLIILYNFLAFGSQVVFGWLVDTLRIPRLSAILGCLLVALAILLINFPVYAIILAGIGNALFHVGGGSISLNINPGKATLPGIFVAPGAVGLTIGSLIGKSDQFISWPFILLLLLSNVVLYLIKIPEINYQPNQIKDQKVNYWELVLLLIFTAIAIRSIIGLTVNFPWKTDSLTLILLTITIALGKALGGVVADRFGWIKTAVTSLLISAPILAFQSHTIYLSLPAIFLFQMTMPITLTATAKIFPNRPAFTFGITCLALISGALPTYTNLFPFLNNPWLTFLLINTSAIALFISLSHIPKISLVNSPNIILDRAMR